MNGLPNILNIFKPSVNVAYYSDVSDISGARISINSRKEIPAKTSVFDVVVIPMDFFYFRVIDIPWVNKEVLAGQIHHFFPISSVEVLWDVIPLPEKSFLIVMNQDVFDRIRSAFNRKTREKAKFIPSITAAAIYHIWNFNGTGSISLPVDTGFLISHFEKSRMTYVEFIENETDEASDIQELNEDRISYHDKNLVLTGAGLFRLISTSFKSHLTPKGFISRIGKQTVFASIIMILSAIFFIYSQYNNDVRNLNLLTSQLENLTAQSKQIDQIITKNEEIAETTRLLDVINEKYTSPYIIINDISANLPESTFIFDFFMDDNKAYITGVSKDTTDVLNILSGRPYISSAEFSSPVIQDNEGNKRFQITFIIQKR